MFSSFFPGLQQTSFTEKHKSTTDTIVQNKVYTQAIIQLAKLSLSMPFEKQASLLKSVHKTCDQQKKIADPRYKKIVLLYEYMVSAHFAY